MIIFIHIIDIRDDTTRPDPNALSTLISHTEKKLLSPVPKYWHQ